MSVEAITWALKQDIKPSGTKFVLVAIANCADGKEGIAWPSVAYLVDATGQDRKTVMAGINRLVAAGYIRDTGERRGLTKQVIVYQLPEFSAFTPIQAQKRNSTENGTVPEFPSNSTEIPSKEYRNSLETVPKTGHGTVRNRQGTTIEPKDISRAKKASTGERIPDDWKPSQADIDFALTTFPHWTAAHLDLVAGGFKDHWLAKPGNDAKKLDWSATWRTWVRNEERYRPFAASPGRMTASRPSFAQQRAQAEIDDFVNGPSSRDDNVIEMEARRVGC